MTLPTTTTLNDCDDDSDMFGPPRSTYNHHHRSRVPMISPKLRLREERKRILQLCAHKLERIKDSETNLRRSVCINNTYCRLTDELRREKQSRYLANLPKSEIKPETARDNIFNPYNSCGIDSSNHQPSNKASSHSANDATTTANNNENVHPCNDSDSNLQHNKQAHCSGNDNNNTSNANSQQHHHHQSNNNNIANDSSQNIANACSATVNSNLSHSHNTANLHPTNSCNSTVTSTNSSLSHSSSHSRKRHVSSNNLDNDLEILDRELNEINAPMPLIDPEITQGAEQLEKAISSRKRSRSEDESDRLVREALSQFYIPPQRLISAIEDCPLDVVSVGVGVGVGSGGGVGLGVSMGLGVGVGMTPMGNCKRQKLSANGGVGELELEFDLNQNQKDFEVIMDALRLGTPSPTTTMGSDSCGQAAMMSESASVFHNLVVTSLET